MDLIKGQTEGLRPDELSFLASLEETPASSEEPPAEEEIVDEPTETDAEPLEDGEEESPDSDDQDDVAEDTDLAAIEEITTADGKKIKIDYEDRDRIKRAHLLARQGRVWQAERDQARKELESLKPEFDEIKSVLNALEEAKEDPAELYRLITGGENWEELIEKEIAQREEIANLSPEQLEVYNKHRIAEKREAELQKREAAWQKKLEEAELQKTEAAKNTQSAMIKGAFNEYRFAGTLGDKAQEYKWDKRAWNNIAAELNGKDLNEFEVRELIKAEFDDLRSMVNNAGKKAATKTHQKTVAKATKKAAVGVNGSSNADDELQEKLAKGDFRGLLSMGNLNDLLK